MAKSRTTHRTNPIPEIPQVDPAAPGCSNIHRDRSPASYGTKDPLIIFDLIPVNLLHTPSAITTNLI